jgi:hypothetical protein
MSLPILVIHLQVQSYLRTSDLMEPARMDAISSLLGAWEISMRLLCGISLIATAFTLMYASSLLDAPSSTESANVSTNLLNPNLKVLSDVYFSCCTVSVLGW